VSQKRSKTKTNTTYLKHFAVQAQAGLKDSETILKFESQYSYVLECRKIKENGRKTQ
jgi:hypothetical protein